MTQATQKDLETLIVRWADAWTANNKEQLLALFTDDCIYDDQPMNIVSQGKEALGGFADFTFGSSEGFTVKLKTYMVSGDQGAMSWTMSATPLVDMPGMPFRAGKRFEIQGASICNFKDGKLHHQTDYWDTAAVLRQSQD